MWPTEDAPRPPRRDDWMSRRAQALGAAETEPGQPQRAALHRRGQAAQRGGLARPGASDESSSTTKREVDPDRGEGRVISLAATDRAAPTRELEHEHGERGRRWRAWAWFVGPFALAAAALGLLLVRQGLLNLFSVACAVLVTLGLGWILVSALFPGRVERRCPACKREGLAPIDLRRSVGLACALCGWRDLEASAFLFLEERGSFEDVVLRERRERPR